MAIAAVPVRFRLRVPDRIPHLERWGIFVSLHVNPDIGTVSKLITIEDFFRLYPISKREMAQKFGVSPKFLYNSSYQQPPLPDEGIKYLNEAIQELSYQLSRTYVHNALS